MTKVEGYREKVFEAFPALEALDGKDKDGQSLMLDDDDYGEEGEFDIEEKLAKLDPELREKYKNGEMDEEEMRNLGLVPDMFYEMEEFGEDEVDEDEGSESGLGKRDREDGS